MQRSRWKRRWIARVLLVPGLLVAGLLVAALVWRTVGILRVEANREFAQPDRGIAVLEALPINGIRQWVSIRGEDRANPVLLFLHGGPGFPMMPFAHVFQQPWERDFIVVQWDQRGTGKTFLDNPAEQVLPTMTVQQFVDDARALAELLRQRLGKRKIIVVGHSWGSMIGMRLVHAHPELFSAYVGTGQVVDVLENEAVGYRRTLQVAREQGNATALRELEAIAPYPDPRAGTSAPRKILRRWQRELGLATRGKSDLEMFAEMLDAGLRSPEYSLGDHRSWLTFASSEFSRNALAAELDSFSLRRLDNQFRLPIFFFLGRQDWQVPSVIAADYAAEIRAPSVQLVWFENSAHSPPSEEAAAFHAALVKYIRPVALAAENE